MDRALSNELIAAMKAVVEGSDNSWEGEDVDVTYEGQSIILPDDPSKMPLRQAAKELIRKAEAEEQVYAVHEMIEGNHQDGLVAFNWAMKDTYGWSNPQPTMSFWGKRPPQLITIKTGPEPEDKIRVAYGKFQLPGVSSELSLSSDRGGIIVSGEFNKREHQVISDLVTKTKLRLKTHSIYKGKAIRLVCVDGEVADMEHINTSKIELESLILNEGELEQVEACLWSPVKNSDKCREHKIPLNRGILLEGEYGTGKTMTASVTSKIAVDNGWTYILLDDVRAMEQALSIAKRYQPSVLFTEDIDRMASGRNDDENSLLNVIDGYLSKGDEVVSVMTTNYVEKLSRAVKRPGRLDAIISIKKPSRNSIKRLVRSYGAGILSGDIDLDKISEMLEGSIPATVREVVERAKLIMLTNGEESISQLALETASAMMKRHIELFEESGEKEVSDGEVLMDVLSRAAKRRSGVDKLTYTRKRVTQTS